MFSDKFKTRAAGLALAAAALAVVPSAAQAGVVVKSSGPSAGDYPVGRQVADSATITLRAGDRITVLTDDGTKVMQGPGTFTVGEGATRTRARFSNLTRRQARSVRTGAVRGAGEGVPRSPNLWFVNVAASGTMCLYDMSAVRLWRPDATGAQTYTIMDPATNASLEVPFVESEAVRALDPEGMQLMGGTNYTISTQSPATEDGEAETTSVSVNFVTLTEEYETPDRLAQALIANGCTMQVELLADTLEASVTP
ncbi:MAG: hypothetical protein ACMUJI_05155 [Erythrobacter sp.]|uniref:hypothetical protein n=1 Tax=Erythrobacter sp. TaxID=1042 RepID=UPI003A885556